MFSSEQRRLHVDVRRMRGRDRSRTPSYGASQEGTVIRKDFSCEGLLSYIKREGRAMGQDHR